MSALVAELFSCIRWPYCGSFHIDEESDARPWREVYLVNFLLAIWENTTVSLFVQCNMCFSFCFACDLVWMDILILHQHVSLNQLAA